MEIKNSRCSAVIIAGGLNSRMGGKNKAFLEIGGKTILERHLDTLQDLFDEIILVTRQPELYSQYPVRVVPDLFEDRASLTGIHSGLYHASHPYSFIVPCDAPFLQKSYIQLLIDAVEPDIDVVIPNHEGFYEPLCAIYSKRCLPIIDEQLKQKNYRIFAFFKNVNVKTISKEETLAVDPKMLSFFNVNTPESLTQAIAVLRNSK